MATTITLDRRALLALINSDPEFALSLKKAVLSTIAERFFEKDVNRIVAAVEPVMFAKALATLQADEDGVALVRRALREAVIIRPGAWGTGVKLNDDMLQLVTEEVARLRNRAIEAAVANVGKEIQDRVEKALVELSLDDRIERRVARLTDEYVNAEVKKRFDQRLAALQAGG